MPGKNSAHEDYETKLLEAQARMKLYADKHRSERTFVPGDQVYLKARPYRQSSMAIAKYHKLLPKYYGPFLVLEKVGTVAYKLQLPANARIHSVFHVSLLKKRISDNSEVCHSYLMGNLMIRF